MVLDRIIEASEWLKREVGAPKVGVFGWSRGAELSMNLATLTQTTATFSAVAAMSGLDYIVGSYDPATGLETSNPGWIYKGQPLVSTVLEVIDQRIQQSGGAWGGGSSYGDGVSRASKACRVRRFKSASGIGEQESRR